MINSAIKFERSVARPILNSQNKNLTSQKRLGCKDSPFWTFKRATPVYLHNLPPNIKNPCRQAANGRVHCDEQNCRKDKNGEQECRSRIHTFQATPNGYISIEEQITIEERISKLQPKS